MPASGGAAAAHTAAPECRTRSGGRRVGKAGRAGDWSSDVCSSDLSLVDRLCEGLFLSPTAQERDDNLLFVRERLLKSEAGYLPEGEARAGVLDLYARVWRSGGSAHGRARVPDEIGRTSCRESGESG